MHKQNWLKCCRKLVKSDFGGEIRHKQIMKMFNWIKVDRDMRQICQSRFFLKKFLSLIFLFTQIVVATKNKYKVDIKFTYNHEESRLINK